MLWLYILQVYTFLGKYSNIQDSSFDKNKASSQMEAQNHKEDTLPVDNAEDSEDVDYEKNSFPSKDKLNRNKVLPSDDQCTILDDQVGKADSEQKMPSEMCDVQVRNKSKKSYAQGSPRNKNPPDSMYGYGEPNGRRSSYTNNNSSNRMCGYGENEEPNVKTNSNGFKNSPNRMCGYGESEEPNVEEGIYEENYGKCVEAYGNEEEIDENNSFEANEMEDCNLPPTNSSKNVQNSRKSNENAQYNKNLTKASNKNSKSTSNKSYSNAPNYDDDTVFDWSPKIRKVVVPGKPRIVCIVKVIPIPVTKDGKPWKNVKNETKTDCINKNNKKPVNNYKQNEEDILNQNTNTNHYQKPDNELMHERPNNSPYQKPDNELVEV
ncbi:hypothetical protein COBT_000263 [Conglomerata obtusa]